MDKISSQEQTRFDNELRARLRQLAARADITIQEVAYRADLPIPTVESWFKPSVRLNPTLKNLRSYVAACDSSLGELFDFTLGEQQSTKQQDIFNVIGRAWKDPTRRRWVESFVEMLRKIERGS